ncbi:MAG: aminotransferase class I/II-fold pyridoxal phosphate-dependent enzyme [Spirochaetes bacterium]|nr:aminotransferase class I/II-fold pyridoxal phosphate-dependent enzyme [Spirochaetota bacterium]
MEKYKRFKTKAIHIHIENELDSNPLNQPIYQTSTFNLRNFENIENLFTLKKRGYVYTRGGNPSVNNLEKKLSVLENAIDGVCFSSGMAAISSVLFSLLLAGDVLVVHDTLYGSTYSFIKDFLSKYNIKAIFCNFCDLKELENIVFNNKPKLLYFETPSNPLLESIDIEEVVNIANKVNAKVVVDNTFLTPYFQNPLDFGVYVVVHSLTKYINGHGDAVGGFACSKDKDYIDYLKFGVMCEIGSLLDPNSAFLISRGLKTLAIRMEEHQKSAIKLANFLERNKKIKKVYYPGLQSYEYKKIIDKQSRGYGGILSFELDADLEKTKRFIESVNIPVLAVSLGDCETLIEHPLSMTHRSYLKKPESEVYKKLQNLVRISTGLEDPDDIIEDLDAALKKI